LTESLENVNTVLKYYVEISVPAPYKWK